MKQLLDLDSWNRKDHFNFFNAFDEPYFGITSNVDCTKAYQFVKENGISFFLFYLYQSLAAANETTPFRYRIDGDKIWIYDQINASPTINRPDGTFGFSYMDYHPTLEAFLMSAEKEIARVRQSTGLDPATSGENVIHYSSIPWIDFTSLSHARHFAFRDSVPKISFGKMTETNGRKQMPISIHVHHGLMDGYHVAQYLENFQEKLNG